MRVVFLILVAILIVSIAGVCKDKKKKCSKKYKGVNCKTHKKKVWLLKKCKETCGLCKDSNDDEEDDDEDDAVVDCANVSGKTFQKQILAAHNCYRSKHENTPVLTWSSAAASHAEKWCAYLLKYGVFKHSSGSGFGENLGMAGGGGIGNDPSKQGSSTVKRWYDEIGHYDWNKPVYSSKVGHFTQVVWKNTSKVGCGYATNGEKSKIYICCNYDPPGNYKGQFEANVQPKK